MRNKQIISLIAAGTACIALIAGMFILSNSLFGSDIQDSSRKNSSDVNGIENTDETISDVSSEPENNEPVVPVPEIPEEPVRKSVTFLAAGDNIVHQAVIDDAKRLAENAGDGSAYLFDPMYDNIKELVSSADIAFINQEGPIAGKDLGYSGYPNFNAPEEAGKALVNIGFDIVNIANNHMLDKGEKGYANSIKFWKSQPVTLVGGYESEEDFNTIRYYEYEGLTIALLSYTYGTNGYYLPAASTMWVPYYNENNVLDRHSKEARSNADIVIASMHWGDENVFAPNSIQKQYCDILVNNNADVIIGTHPHVLQPVEWRDRPDGRKTLVAYSLGNLLSTMHNFKNMVGGLLTFEISYTEPEDAEITNPKIIPTLCYYSKSRDSLKLYKLSDFTREMFSTHGSTLQEQTSYEAVLGYVTNTIDSEFLDREFLASLE